MRSKFLTMKKKQVASANKTVYYMCSIKLLFSLHFRPTTITVKCFYKMNFQ